VCVGPRAICGGTSDGPAHPASHGITLCKRPSSTSSAARPGTTRPPTPSARAFKVARVTAPIASSVNYARLCGRASRPFEHAAAGRRGRQGARRQSRRPQASPRARSDRDRVSHRAAYRLPRFRFAGDEVLPGSLLVGPV
jgi:hypothetical protein